MWYPARVGPQGFKRLSPIGKGAQFVDPLAPFDSQFDELGIGETVVYEYDSRFFYTLTFHDLNSLPRTRLDLCGVLSTPSPSTIIHRR